jgi:hypothetical protein
MDPFDSFDNNRTTAMYCETFCFMVMEDFFIRKGMHSTLQSFRNEWQRPSEVIYVL